VLRLVRGGDRFGVAGAWPVRYERLDVGVRFERQHQAELGNGEEDRPLDEWSRA
jgi:hypothetical protein